MQLEKDLSQLIKGIAIISIFISHYGFLGKVAASGVALFLFLSGYGIHTSVSRKGTNGFWKKRLIGVIVPYLCIVIIGSIIVFIFNNTKFSVMDYLLYILCINFNCKIDPTMWYITYQFIWYGVYYLSYSLGKKRVLIIELIISLPIILILTKYTFAPGPGVVLYFPYFVLGVLFSEYGKIIKPNRYILSIISVISMLITCITLFFSLRNNSIYLYFVFVAISSFSVIVTVLTFYKRNNIFSDILCKIGSFSYELYLIEGLILIYLRGTNIINTGHTYIDSLCYIVITFILSFLYSLGNTIIQKSLTTAST